MSAGELSIEEIILMTRPFRLAALGALYSSAAIFIRYDASLAFSVRNAPQRGTGKVPVKQRTR
jgi:hypothetical protein